MKRSAVNILASYIDALHPIIYINHFDFKVIDDAIARVGKGIKCIEYNNALGIVDFYNKSPIRECSLEQFLKVTMDDGFDQETYLILKDIHAWYLAVVIYGREFKYYKIERDEAVIADLIQIEKAFWENHVMKQQIPDPDGSKLADSVIAEYYKNSIADTIPLTGFNEKLERRQELSELIGRMDMEKKKIEQELKLYLGENERAENEQFMVSWKSVQSNRLDEKRLKEEEPEIYEKYKKSVSSRRFTVKAA